MTNFCIYLSVCLSLCPWTCFCMFLPLSVSLPPSLPRLLSRSERAYVALRVVLCPQALGDWGPIELEPQSGEPKRQEFSMRWPLARYCYVCKKHSFPSQLKPW